MLTKFFQCQYAGMGHGADPDRWYCAWYPYSDECTKSETTDGSSRKRREMTKAEFEENADTDIGKGYN